MLALAQALAMQGLPGLPNESLNLTSGAGGGHALGAFGGREGGDAEVVGRCPEPNAVGMIGIAGERDQDVSMASGIDVGRSILGAVSHDHMISGQHLGEVFNRDWLLGLEVDGEGVPMEDWRLDHEQRGLGCTGGNLPVVFQDSAGDRFEREVGARSGAGDHVEGDLDVVDVLGQFLEREQVHGLLVEFPSFFAWLTLLPLV